MVIPKQIYQQALGIRTGDIITTSYGSGPYQVWSIHGPHLWDKGIHWIIYPWPVISLKLIFTKDHHLFGKCIGEGKFSYINEIHRQEDRWFTTIGDEIFVKPPRLGYPDLPVDMFRSYPPDPEPYPFQDGVDYRAGHRRVWHCCHCGLDFNWQPDGGYGLPRCPQCNHIVTTRIVVAAVGENTYVKTLG